MDGRTNGRTDPLIEMRGASKNKEAPSLIAQESQLTRILSVVHSERKTDEPTDETDRLSPFRRVTSRGKTRKKRK